MRGGWKKGISFIASSPAGVDSEITPRNSRTAPRRPSRNRLRLAGGRAGGMARPIGKGVVVVFHVRSPNTETDESTTVVHRTLGHGLERIEQVVVFRLREQDQLLLECLPVTEGAQAPVESSASVASASRPCSTSRCTASASRSICRTSSGSVRE